MSDFIEEKKIIQPEDRMNNGEQQSYGLPKN